MDFLYAGATILGLIAIAFALSWLKGRLVSHGPCLHLRPTALSKVPDHQGPCAMTWYGGGVFSRFDGGVTGFFRRCRRIGPVWVSFGPEFHGIALYGSDGKTVNSTARDHKLDW